MQFTKLFSCILDSTIWQEPPQTKILWITMLAMSDRNGEVHASVPGLAKRAGITLPECERGIACLMAPDAYSRTKDHEGRRVGVIDGGWALLNHAKYRALLSAEERREYNRQKQAEFRAKHKASSNVNDSQSPSAMSAHTESEAEPEADKKIPLPLAGAEELFDATPAATVKPKVAKPKAPKKPREPDPIFDALAEVSGMAGKVNSMSAGRIAFAKKNILQICPGVTPDDIRAKAGAFRKKWNHLDVTPTGLAANWATLESAGTSQDFSRHPDFS